MDPWARRLQSMSKIPVTLPNGRYARTDPEFHQRAFKLRGWTVTTVPDDLDISRDTLNNLLYRRDRRDADGMVAIEIANLFKLHLAYKKYRPIFKIARPPQGPPVRRKLPDQMTGPYPGMAGRRRLSNYDDDEDDAKTSLNSE